MLLAHDINGQEIMRKNITIDAANKSIKFVLTKIEEQAGVTFMYSPTAIKANRKISIHVVNKPLDQVLQAVLSANQIAFRITGNKIVLRYHFSEKSTWDTGNSELRTEKKGSTILNPVKGKVTDEKGEPLAGVTIQAKESAVGTTTNEEGEFEVDLPANSIILISLIGYESKEVVLQNASSLSIQLKASSNALNEVVVVGYGSQSRRNVTGSISKMEMKQLEGLPNTNVTQAIRGRVAGVQFTDNGRPGQGGSILIRGTRSITASNDPLIIVDGIFFNGNLADINPNDIESMEILKDASAGAIYGSRAANGVILINSKKGSGSKPTIRFNTYGGISDWSNRMKILSAERYIEKTLDVRKQTGQSADPAQIASYLTNTEAENYNNGRTVDPWDEISQRGSILSADISVSGKAGKTSYFISAARVEEKGLIFNDNANRNSIRINLETAIKSWFKIGVNSQFSIRNLSGKEADTQQGYTLSPFGKLFFDSARKDPVPYPVDDQIQRSPLFNSIFDKDEDKKQNLFANVYALIDIPFVKGLSYRINYSPNLRWEHRYQSSPIYKRNGLNNLGSASKYNREDFDWVLENILNYSRAIGENHQFDVTALYGRNQRKWESTNANASNFFTDVLSWNNMNIAQVQQNFSDAQQVDGISSMLRINYQFKNKYLLTLTTRRDGTSVFGANHKFGVFPSVAAAWILSDEKFMERFSAIEYLKLRFSYGSVGNQAINPYQSLARSSTTQYVFGDGGSTSNAVFTSSMANPNLRWETTVSQNYALDFELFKGRLGGTLEFYSMRTKDLLLNRSLPSPTGFSQVLTNLGETQNEGIEITLNSRNIQSKNFNWNSSLLFSTNKNRIVHLYGSDNNGDGKEDDDLGNRWFIGQPIQINYDYVMEGIYQEGDDMPAGYKPGFIRFRDMNKDGKIDAADRTVISQREPKYRWGLNNTVSYKNLSLSVFINAMTGWSQSFYLLDPVNNYPSRPVNMLDAGWWTEENKSNSRPSLVYTNPLGYQYYTSRDFVRIQDLMLSYEIPASLLQKWKMQSLRVYISAKNIKTFTDYVGQDPESGYNYAGYPTPRTVAAGINLSF